MKVDICDRNKICFLIFSPKISAISAKFQQFLRRFPEFVHLSIFWENNKYFKKLKYKFHLAGGGGGGDVWEIEKRETHH